MSDDQSDGSARKAVYRRPPVEHQFKKGQSGNPRGRPPKAVRALTPRQLRRDVINVAEKLTRIKTAEGIKEVPIIEAVMMQLANRALQGHGPSLRYFRTEYSAAVREHHDTHREYFGFVDLVEHEEVESPRSRNTSLKFLNNLRRKTRKV